MDESAEFLHAREDREDAVDRVKEALPEDEVLYDLAELFKIFGDSTRVKLLYILSLGEMCVYDLAQLLGVTQSAVSHQLRALKASKLVRYRREGKNILYALADGHVRTILDQGLEHVEE